MDQMTQDGIRIHDNERIDDLQVKGYRIIQKTDGFCFGMDAVLLSDYAKVRPGTRLIDLCSGTGIVPLLVEAKYQIASAQGLEYFPEYVEMAGRSIAMNGLSDRLSVIEGDVRYIEDYYPRECCEYVTCNPPYMVENHGRSNDDYKKAAARHEILCAFKDVVRAARWILKTKGHFILIHRPFRLAEIIYELKAMNLEPKKMRLVYPYVHKEPNMVLIDCIKDARPGMIMDPPLIVYNNDGSYSDEIYKIYGGIM